MQKPLFLLYASVIACLVLSTACSSEESYRTASAGYDDYDSGSWTDSSEDTDSAAPDAQNAGNTDADESGSSSDCFEVDCPAGFYCEFGVCIPDGSSATTPVAALASDRYLYSLEVEKRRIVRIDAQEFQVDALETGLAPMDMQVMPGGERLMLADASDTVEIITGAGLYEARVIWDTARSLSHVKIAPGGDHVVVYYDWDDPRALDRQPNPGNINQVSILAVGTNDAMGDDDDHLVDLSVGLLPRDVQFSADGAKAVIIGRREVTTVNLLSFEEGVAVPTHTIDIDESAIEFLVNDAASEILLRYDGQPQLDVVDLISGEVTCLQTEGTILDITETGNDQFLVAFTNDEGNHMSQLSFTDAAESCEAQAGTYAIGNARTLAYDPESNRTLAYVADEAVENLWFIDLVTDEQQTIRLEKAVSAVAFSDSGTIVRIAHLKADGTPAWNPTVEDTDVSIDKSYGVSWIDLTTGLQRLTIRDEPFGPFSFAPALLGRVGATYQALSEDSQPRLLVVEHSAGFNESWIDLASETEHMGYILSTDSIYAIQDHPMGRVTFVNAESQELRHVTGYALDLE